MSKRFKDTQTLDLFERVYPVRRPPVISQTVDLSGKIKRLVSLILKESPKTREQLAAEMAEAMDCPSFSKAMLDNYSSEANELHQIPLYRFIVLVRVADAAWAWDELLKDEGFTVLFGDEALLAERGRVAQQIEELKKYQKELNSVAPVKIRRRS
ncbi:MAG: hypothetical protein IJ752_07445 [Alphaproteobacteria bacterium]|nr:hypothetical protein [Alphaproteobacteria bacterium]